MAGLFGKLFGKKKREDGPEAVVEDLLAQLVRLADLELSCDVKSAADGTVNVEISGADEELLTRQGRAAARRTPVVRAPGGAAPNARRDPQR